MSEKSRRIFISSTLEDLAEYRHAVRDAILSVGAMPILLEDQPASGSSIAEKVEGWIDQSDAVILLLGWRYGAINPETGKSWIEAEYEAVIRRNKPFMVFLVHEDALWPLKFVDRDTTRV